MKRRKITPKRKTPRKVEPRKPYRGALQLEPKQKLGPGAWKKKPTKLSIAKLKPKTLVTGRAPEGRKGLIPRKPGGRRLPSKDPGAVYSPGRKPMPSRPSGLPKRIVSKLVTGRAPVPKGAPGRLSELRGRIGVKRPPKVPRPSMESPRKLPRGKPVPGVAKRPGKPPTEYESWLRRERALKRPAKPLKRVTLGRGVPIAKPAKRGKQIKRKARPIRRRRI